MTGGTAQKPQSYTLQANDEHDKRQWVSSIRAMLAAERERLGIIVTSDAGRDCVDQNRPLTRTTSRCSFRLKRKSSSASLTSMTSMSSIGSVSSLYSVMSYDTDESSSVLSLGSVSSGNDSRMAAGPAGLPVSPATSVTSECSETSEVFPGATPPSAKRSSRRRSSYNPDSPFCTPGASPNTTVISTALGSPPEEIHV